MSESSSALGGQANKVTRSQQPDAITGIEALRGAGVKEPLGFWADAWSQVIRRPGAVLALTWVLIVAFFAVFAPLVANGHPIFMRSIDTRTAADASRAVAGAVAGDDAVPVDRFRQALRLELKDHSPRLAVDDLLAGVSLETVTVERFDAAGDLQVIDSLTPDALAAALDQIASTPALDATGGVTAVSSPLLQTLSAADWLILAVAVLGLGYIIWPRGKLKRSTRAWMLIAMSAQAVLLVALAGWVDGKMSARDAAPWLIDIQRIGLDDNPPPDAWRPFVTLLVSALATLTTVVMLLIPSPLRFTRRLVMFAVAGAIAATATAYTWGAPPAQFDYREREAAGQIDAVFTLVPFSPTQRELDRNAGFLPPGSTTGQALARRLTSALPLRGPIGDEGAQMVLDEARRLPIVDDRREQLVSSIAAAIERLPDPFAAAVNDRRVDENQRKQQRAGANVTLGTDDLVPENAETFADLRIGEAEDFLKTLLSDVGQEYVLGSDGTGQDVLSQLLHACRLSMSVGLVATGIAVTIGVTMGALMGYFGGLLDLALYRVVEVFMAIPVLFLLIVAADVLPRNTYVMMAIIGMFTWHGAARFTRAEFYKLRNQDFVQAARAAGLPLRSVLFKHMLPNGVTPVLVDASFRIALAILFESILSYLGLGPEDQPSWGRLLSEAIRAAGGFNWWLAIFPGFAIFLTVLGYNLIGEALRDAIDPKLKKARV
jgi:ABC-type dipeptide/oligopeptide/nickel transport system permease subunit